MLTHFISKCKHFISIICMHNHICNPQSVFFQVFSFCVFFFFTYKETETERSCAFPKVTPIVGVKGGLG